MAAAAALSICGIGIYHQARFADYAAVIDDYDRFLELGLDPREQGALEEFLKSL